MGLSCGMWHVVPWLGIEPGPPTLGVQSLNHGTTKEVPQGSFNSKLPCPTIYPAAKGPLLADSA